ncbi:MAG: monovalent cation/H+ antiporter complex subunit F [Bacteroidota bacterium]|nr:monovalent cation/H+ antiporter complex subunit F [Bacteroidota bacterium]MDO9613529.1 monovalent cation/H+ antiporter complex subunit F [Bacteroidota bacterium]
MMFWSSNLSFLENASLTALGIMTLSLLFPLYRLFKGPSLPDRIVALDQIGMIIVGIILCDVIYSRDTMVLDVVLAISFLLVFGSMIIARYLYKKTELK